MAGRQERPDEGACLAVGATSVTWSELGEMNLQKAFGCRAGSSEFFLRTTENQVVVLGKKVSFSSLPF